VVADGEKIVALMNGGGFSLSLSSSLSQSGNEFARIRLR
jgi:hypothetical protein